MCALFVVSVLLVYFDNKYFHKRKLACARTINSNSVPYFRTPYQNYYSQTIAMTSSSSFPSELVLPQSLNFAIDGSPYRTRSRRHELNDNNNKETLDNVSASDTQDSDVDAQNVDKANNNNMKTGFMQSFYTRNVVADQTENSNHENVNANYNEDQYNNHNDNDNTATTTMLSFGKPSAALANLISQVEYNHDNETSSDEDEDEAGSTCSNGFYQEEVEQQQQEQEDTDTSSPSRQRQNSHRSPSPTTRRHQYNHHSSTPAAVAFTPQAVFVSTVKKSRETEQQQADADDVEEQKRVHATRDLNKLLEEKVSAASSLKQQKSNNNNYLPQLAQWIMISQDQADEQQQQHNNHANSRRMSSMMDFKTKSFRPGRSQIDHPLNASVTSTSSVHHQHQRFRGLKDRKEGMLNCLNDLISFSESAGQNVGKRNKENKKNIENRYQTCTAESSEKKKTAVRAEAVKSLSMFFGL